MDNLQEIAIYLAALVDGEGYIQLTSHPRAKGKIRLLAAISISNTDTRIIERVRWALDVLGISYHVYESTRNVSKGGKPDFTINISRLTQVKRILEVLLLSPYLGKRNEVTLLLEFVNSRIGPDGQPWPRGGKGDMRSTPYSQRDAEIASAISSYGCHKFQTPQRAYVQTPQAEDVLCSSVKAEETPGNEESPESQPE
jgi:hypothetical protein